MSAQIVFIDQRQRQNGRLWVNEWNAGKLALYDPATKDWRKWRLHGKNTMPIYSFRDEK
jgi:virginiamycin B lyase